MSWTYKGAVFMDHMIPEGAVGFVYVMSAIIGSKSVSYIGKKNFYANRKVKLGKKALPTDKRKKGYKQVQKLDYQNYFSSNEVLKAAKVVGVAIKREIIQICFSKTELTYYETKLQFMHGVLESNIYLNGNILGRFYKLK